MTIATAPATTRRKRVRRADAALEQLNAHLSAAADLQRQIQALELQLQQHRAWLLTHLQTTGGSVTLGSFTASLRSRSNWTYSVRLANEMLRIKQEQALQQADGTAINNPTPYVALTFKAR